MPNLKCTKLLVQPVGLQGKLLNASKFCSNSVLHFTTILKVHSSVGFYNFLERNCDTFSNDGIFLSYRKIYDLRLSRKVSLTQWKEF
jgi:hypothetical protein